jgi:oligopeptide transport system substrate-binding protein
VFIATIAAIYISSIKIKERLPMLNLNMKAQPKTLDPRKVTDIFSSQMIFLLFEGLVKRYPDGSIKLAQAESYKVSDDQLTYTFTLRDTVWSNNTPVTAYDFEQTWKDVLKPDFPSVNAQLFSPIKNAEAAKKGLVSLDKVGIHAFDAKTLIITLEKPTSYLFQLFSFCAFFPVNKKNDCKNPNWNHKKDQCLSNGPFLLEKWDHGNQIVFIKNPRYRKTEDLHPEKIVFNIVENDAVTLEMFQQGLIDIIGDSLTNIPLESIPTLEKKWTFSYMPRPRSVFISINTERFPFNNPKIRKAFSFAINRQELIGLMGKGVKQNILTDRINLAYQGGLSIMNMIPPCLKENRYRSFCLDNNAEKARNLLKEGMIELGITKKDFDSAILNYHSQNYGISELVQDIQQKWLQTLGIFIKLERLDFSIGIDKMRTGDYSMCFMCWDAMYYDPMSILERFKYKTYATNFSNWENQEYIELLDRSFYEQEDKRLLTLEKAEKIFINEMPYIPLYHEDYVYMVNPSLPYSIPLWGDRMLLPLSLEEKKVQEENKNANQRKPLGILKKRI